MSDPMLRALRIAERYHDPQWSVVLAVMTMGTIGGIASADPVLVGFGGLGSISTGTFMLRQERRWQPIDDVPTCDCGQTMDVDRGQLVDVFCCPTGECRCEGARGPLWNLWARLQSRWSA